MAHFGTPYADASGAASMTDLANMAGEPALDRGRRGEFGISDVSARAAVNRKTWAHVS